MRERFFRNRNDKCIYIENGASRRKKTEYEKEAIFVGKKSRKITDKRPQADLMKPNFNM